MKYGLIIFNSLVLFVIGIVLIKVFYSYGREGCIMAIQPMILALVSVLLLLYFSFSFLASFYQFKRDNEVVFLFPVIITSAYLLALIAIYVSSKVDDAGAITAANKDDKYSSIIFRTNRTYTFNDIGRHISCYNTASYTLRGDTIILPEAISFYGDTVGCTQYLKTDSFLIPINGPNERSHWLQIVS